MYSIEISKYVVNSNCSKSIALERHGGIPSSLHFMGLEIKCPLGNLFLGLHDMAFPGCPSTSLFHRFAGSFPDVLSVVSSKTLPLAMHCPASLIHGHAFSCHFYSEDSQIVISFLLSYLMQQYEISNLSIKCLDLSVHYLNSIPLFTNASLPPVPLYTQTTSL